MNMTRYVMTVAAVFTLLATTACSDSATKTSAFGTMQISAVHWDEMAAATTSAHVSNNGLIMMR